MKPLVVRDLMTVGVPTCRRDSPATEVAQFLLQHNVEAMCVLDEEGHGIGVLGIEELLKSYGREGLEDLAAEDVMQEGIPELQADLPLKVAAQIMQDTNTRIAFVMHSAAGITYPAAYLSSRHILRHIAARTEDELKDLGTSAARKSPIEQFMERRDEARRRNLAQGKND